MKQFFDVVECVNLERRIDRLEHFKGQAEKIGLKHNIFPAFDGQKLDTRPGKPPFPGWSTISMGNYANVLSQRHIIQMASLQNRNSIMILEDDVKFNCTPDELDSYLTSIPNNWDMIYFGGNHREPLIPIDDRIGRCQFTLTAHAVGIRDTMFQHLLYFTQNADRPIDLYYAMLHKMYNVYCPLKGLATQLDGYSDIESKDVNYQGIIN